MFFLYIRNIIVMLMVFSASQLYASEHDQVFYQTIFTPTSSTLIELESPERRYACACGVAIMSGPMQCPHGARYCLACLKEAKKNRLNPSDKLKLNAYHSKCLDEPITDPLPPNICKADQTGLIKNPDCVNYVFLDKALSKEINALQFVCTDCQTEKAQVINVTFEKLKEHAKKHIVSCPYCNNNYFTVTLGTPIDKRREDLQAHENECPNNKNMQKYTTFMPTTNHALDTGADLRKYQPKSSSPPNTDELPPFEHITYYLTEYFKKCPTPQKDAHKLYTAMQKHFETHQIINSPVIPANNSNRFITEDYFNEQDRDKTDRLAAIDKLLEELQTSITEINRTYEEVSLTLQTLQATSYDGKYIWKIPDIARRRRDAVMGKTVSLYSAPFYTYRFGYRMCLRVYLDGDGSGKGRYISYFLTIMKGEYDALLEWPFKLTVTLTLINQKDNGNIVQTFKPNPKSDSFQRPKADMNVASGCPKFVSLPVLDNPEFIVDDTAFFQCLVTVSK